MLIGYAELTVSPLKLQHTGSDRSVIFPHLSSWSSDVIWPCRFSQVADFPVRQLRGRRTQDTCKSSEYIFNYTDCLDRQVHSIHKNNDKKDFLKKDILVRGHFKRKKKKEKKKKEKERSWRNSFKLRQNLKKQNLNIYNNFCSKHLTEIIRIQISKAEHGKSACYVRTLHLFWLFCFKYGLVSEKLQNVYVMILRTFVLSTDDWVPTVREESW